MKLYWDSNPEPSGDKSAALAMGVVHDCESFYVYTGDVCEQQIYNRVYTKNFQESHRTFP